MSIGRPITISMIIPVYRVEEYISRMAESVFSQSYPHIQYIFVNDETDDASIDILNSLIQSGYAHMKDRIMIVNQPHAGLPAARREGMKYATGDYVWHLDSDDWVEPDAAEKIAGCAQRTDADIIYFDFYCEYACKTVLAEEKDYDSTQKSLYQRNIYCHKAYACVWNKCVKRSLYVDNTVHFPEYSHAEDAVLMLQMIGYASSIVHLKEPLYHYRKDNPRALTRQGHKYRVNELILNYMALCEQYEGAVSDPVACIIDDVYYRAGRSSLLYGLGLYDRYPCLAGKILEKKLKGESYVSVPTQILLKIYASLRCRRS